MISLFIEVWPLFKTTCLTGILLASVLSVSGLLLLARNQIFMGVSLAQSATLGYALMLLLDLWGHRYGFYLHQYPLILKGGAIAACVLANLLLESRNRGARESAEAGLGWMFLFTSSFSILLVSGSPLGMDEVQRILSSSLIGASEADLWITLVLAVATVALLAWKRDEVVLSVIDPGFSDAIGIASDRRRIAAAVWLAVVTALGITISGLIFTFACLLLPGMIAARLSRTIRPLFWLAPLIGAAATLAGFVLSVGWDLPPGQLTAALLSTLLGLMWLTRRTRVAPRA